MTQPNGYSQVLIKLDSEALVKIKLEIQTYRLCTELTSTARSEATSRQRQRQWHVLTNGLDHSDINGKYWIVSIKYMLRGKFITYT